MLAQQFGKSGFTGTYVSGDSDVFGFFYFRHFALVLLAKVLNK
jgi:hypothetical protein